MTARKEIPYFLEIRGCINCSASVAMKKKTGFEYGFDHELIVACLLRNCSSYGHDLISPYYDPEELVRIAKKIGTPEVKESARNLCLQLNQRFSWAYKREGIDIKAILGQLDEV